MSIIGSNVLAGASGGAADTGYQIQRSLRFNGSDSAYLSKTPASAGNRTTWTWSAWVKRSGLGTYQHLFSHVASAASQYPLSFTDTNALTFYVYTGSFTAQKTTTQVFRDTSAWYHIVATWDTTNATAADRMRLYVNGSRVTTFSASVDPSQNLNSQINNTVEHGIGTNTPFKNGYANFYLADVHFIDGQALAPTDFGEFDDNNVWQPKAFTGGSYGTNGFKLNFSDNSSNAALGTDSSGNGNTWTVNNLSVAAGAGNDSVVDTPTNYGDDTGAGGEVRGNYATFNPLSAYGPNPGLSDGNLRLFNYSGTGWVSQSATILVNSGKWYFETLVLTMVGGGNGVMIGISKDVRKPFAYFGDTADSYGYFSTGQTYTGASASSYAASFTTSDVIGCAFDADNGILTFYKNGVSQGTAFSSLSTSDTWQLGAGCYSNQSSISANFGQRAWEYTPPSGYKALCTTNLPDPTIADGSAYMDVVTYAGDGNSTKTISGLSFGPDLVWLKNRTTAYSHLLYDVVRGAGSNKALFSNDTFAEGLNDNSTYGYLSAFNSDGFSVVKGTDATSYTNGSSQSYVAWTWDAGANSSKTYAVTVVSDSGNKYRFDGFGTSAVTLDLEEGSTYTFDQSDSSNAGHPLRFSTTSNGTHGGGSEYTTGVVTNGTPGSAGAYTRITVAASAPTLYYYCSVHSGMGGQANTNSTAGASNFDGSIQSTVRTNANAGFSVLTYTAGASGSTVGHGLGATPELIIVKSRTNGSYVWAVYHASLGSSSYLILNTTGGAGTLSNYWGSPSSTTFGISNFGYANNDGNLVGYCFSAVSGYSSFGSYIGNGSTDGPFVFTGFRIRWLLWTASSAAGYDWRIIDTARDQYNVSGLQLYPNTSGIEQDYRSSLGIDLLSNGFKIRNASYENTSGVTYIWAAFASNPFKTARAR